MGRSVGFQTRVGMPDGGVEKVNKAWDQNRNVRCQMGMEWNTDSQVVLGLDETDVEVDALEVLQEKVRLVGSTTKSSAKNATE